MRVIVAAFAAGCECEHFYISSPSADDILKIVKGDLKLGILAWIVLGGIAGWVASMIAGNNEEQGLIGNIIIGILGAFIGGFIINLVGGEGITGFNLWSLLVATGGAILLLLILGRFRHTTA